ncbi:MAG: SDR family oxidoreductase [Hyphomonas sp.]|nr:SDR family oxidoreductase [Hyphomonas sp.]
MTDTATLITGASKGIGRALAVRLAKRGLKVIGLARGSSDDFPGELVQVDLADSAATDAALREITARVRLDAVVNNVGLVRHQLLGEIEPSELAAVLDVNLRPALQATQAALPSMRAVGRGRVINISSLTVLGLTHRTSYAAAKAAMVSFTRTWALELAETGITVNAVAPGPTETELFRAGTPVGSDKEGQFLSLVPMRRFARPEEIAGTIDFLLSDDAAYITGQTIFVDGGASIGRASF